jgi:hypothetical protein
VAAISAAYPQKGIPQKSGTSWLFRGFGTQPHESLKPFLVFKNQNTLTISHIAIRDNSHLNFENQK